MKLLAAADAPPVAACGRAAHVLQSQRPAPINRHVFLGGHEDIDPTSQLDLILLESYKNNI